MQARPVLLLEQAAEDMEAGRLFYEKQGEGLGFLFLQSLLADLSSLQTVAGIHSRRFGGYRMLARKFPFAIYYDLPPSTVRVIAILDMRSNPSWIHDEIQKR
mgnify:CR=1 FL=1